MLLKVIATTPLILIPFSILLYDSNVIFPFITLKAFAFHALILFSLFITTGILIFDKSSLNLLWILINNQIIKIYILFILLISIVSLFSSNSVYSFAGSIERLDGIYLYLSLTYLIILLNLVFDKNQWKIIFSVIVIVGLILFIFQFLQYKSGIHRPGSLINHPAFLSSYYLLCIGSVIIVCRLYFSEKRKALNFIIKYGTIAIFCYGILISGTRGSGLALILTTILILYIEKEKYLSYKNSYFIIIVFLILTYYFYSKDFKFRIFDVINDNSTINSRLINYKISFQSINPFAEDWSKLIFGWGWNNFYLAWDKYYIDQIKLYDPLSFDKAHNFYIDLLVNTGVLGCFIYGLFIKEIYKNIFSVKDNNLKVGLLFIFTGHFIELIFNFDSIANYISIQIILSYLIALSLEDKNEI